MGEADVKNLEKNADVIYGWSLYKALIQGHPLLISFNLITLY